MKKQIKDQVIHCQTEEEANKLMQILEDRGMTWAGRDARSLSGDSKYDVYHDQTCYQLKIASNCVLYADRECFIEEGYSIISFDDFNTKTPVKKPKPTYTESHVFVENDKCYDVTTLDVDGVSLKRLTEHRDDINAKIRRLKYFVKKANKGGE